jgi:hypothetical protein
MRISWLRDNQNEFDIAESAERTAESARDMTALWNPPHAAAFTTEAGTRTVGGAKQAGQFGTRQEVARINRTA